MAGLVLVGLVGWQLTVLAVAGVGQIFDATGAITSGPTLQLHPTYTVSVGDTLAGIAAHFRVSEKVLIDVNHLQNPNLITVGQKLIIPTPYHPAQTRRLIVATANHYHLDPAFALAIADQESGFNENALSPTGAIGVMQIEPQTGRQIAQDLGRTIDLGIERDNVTVGAYWLAYLVRYYGGNERSAAAAYYEGQGNLAARGYVGDTSTYVADVMALRQRYAGS